MVEDDTSTQIPRKDKFIVFLNISIRLRNHNCRIKLLVKAVTLSFMPNIFNL